MNTGHFLGIYKVSETEYIGTDCWSECQRYNCKGCARGVAPVFRAESFHNAVALAQEFCDYGDYEYDYEFLNLGKGLDSVEGIHEPTKECPEADFKSCRESKCGKWDKDYKSCYALVLVRLLRRVK